MGPTSLYEDLPAAALPENSLAAFQESIDRGADGIEFDVHLTRDGRLAVIHDHELNKKLAGANRQKKDLGSTYDFNMASLALLDVGNGHKIPSLEDTLDLIVQNNKAYRELTGKNLTIDIELKGEGTALPVAEAISKYVERGDVAVEDFIFNSFDWSRLEEIKTVDADFKVMPAIKTKDLFGEHNVSMPGYVVTEGAEYCPATLQRLADFNEKCPCHAFDCIIFDLRPELIDFCESTGVGLFTSTSYDRVDVERVKEPMRLMVEASSRLPFTGFRADDVAETNALVMDVLTESNAVRSSRKQKEYPPLKVLAKQ